MSDSNEGLKNYANNRNQRPALLPTPTIPPRFNRNMSMNSDSSRGMIGPDDIESVDMEMSDDDTGMDNRSVGSSGGEFKSIVNKLYFNQHIFHFRSPRFLNVKYVPIATSGEHESTTTIDDDRQRYEPSKKVMDAQSRWKRSIYMR